MWRLWMMYDARRLMLFGGAALFTLAILIHFILLSSPRYNWLETAPTQTGFETSILEDVRNA